MAPRQRLVAIHPVHGYAIAPPQDLRTMKRNARERNRVQTVNQSFEALRRVVPTAAAHKKLSKVNIIQQAMEYIHCLMQLVDQDSASPSPSFSSSSYTPSCCSSSASWPSPPPPPSHSSCIPATCWAGSCPNSPPMLTGQQHYYPTKQNPHCGRPQQADIRGTLSMEENSRHVEDEEEEEEVLNAIVDWQRA